MPIEKFGDTSFHANFLKVFAVFSLAVGCTGQPGDPLTEIGNGIKQGMRDSGFNVPGGPSGGASSLEAVGLKDIMPQYDPSRPLSQQFPHVALTVRRAPPNWMGTAMQNNAFTGGFSNIQGCWTMTAVVWSSATASRNVGPFDWCGPRDVRITPGPQAGMGLLKMVDIPYSSGINRTNGPRPPSTLFPEDRHDYKNGFVPAIKYSQFTGSALWLMYGNVIYTMGSSLGTWGDYRVWIVSIDAW